MKFNNKTVIIFAVSTFLFTVSCLSQQKNLPAIESFETESILRFYDKQNCNLSLSEDHQRLGRTSLKWEWKGESYFGTSNFKILSRDESPLKYGSHFPSSPTLHLSVYNETPQDEKLLISYEKEGETEVWFHINLTFQGWRRIWVPFYEMNGKPPKKGEQVNYDYFKISTTSKSGALFFDDIIFSQYQDDRNQYPDHIVPFIKKDKKSYDDHWMPLISNYELIENLNASPISPEERLDLKKFQQLIDIDLEKAQNSKLNISVLVESFQNLNLKEEHNYIKGPPLTFQLDEEYHNTKKHNPYKFNKIHDLGKVLKQLANHYETTNSLGKKKIEDMFTIGTKYFLDQGWQVGSSGGTRHHVGYSLMEIVEAFYKMRNLLRQKSLLNDVAASLHWLFNLGIVLGDEKDFHVNIDYLNTQSYCHLMLIFLMDSQEKQAALLRAYSNYISIILAQENEQWGFKVDGTAWHHNGHYPAYAIGAFKTVPKIIKTLSGTGFRIKAEGHRNFKRAFLASQIYSQLYNWGFGVSGRHPLDDNNSIEGLKDQFLLMAHSGNPDGTSKIDKDVSSAYLRLWGKNDVLNSSLFTDVSEIKKDKLVGYYPFPYAALSVHRRKDWAAIIKGYSKYIWASEIYVDENRYGRYPSNGTIQLLNENGAKGSGFYQEGWDWNRYPGATIVYLPFEELEPETPLIMFRSNETFAGVCELNCNGVFSMVLNESNGSNADGPESKIGFPGMLKAKKSVFSFDEKMICIGTNISSVDEQNPTQTNLFQSYLINPKTAIYSSNGTLTQFPMTKELKPISNNKNWIVDPYGNGYHILSKSSIHIKKELQHSFHNKYSVRTGKMNSKGKGAKETKGNFASAWLDHGKAPSNASYQYVIYPFLKGESVRNFGKKVKKDTSYSILRADSIAHVVLDKTSNTTGYAVFEANKEIECGLLKSVSAPSIVMINQEKPEKLELSIVQPDLNFYEYEKGKFRNNSRPVELTLKIEGKWTTIKDGAIKAIDNNGKITVVTLLCTNGLSEKLLLKKL